MYKNIFLDSKCSIGYSLRRGVLFPRRGRSDTIFANGDLINKPRRQELTESLKLDYT